MLNTGVHVHPFPDCIHDSLLSDRHKYPEFFFIYLAKKYKAFMFRDEIFPQIICDFKLVDRWFIETMLNLGNV